MKFFFILASCVFLSRHINDAQSSGNVDTNKLQISRVIDENKYSEIHLGVQELAGQNLTLSCDLFTADNSAYDDQIAWGKATSSFKFKNESELESLAKRKSAQMFAYFSRPQSTQELNRAVKTFAPLREDDAGTYFCGSMKYMIFEIVYVVVKPRLANRSDAAHGFAHSARKDMFCNERMFKCRSGGACIMPHYVCDRRPDCADRSDESHETCGGDPCAGKIACADGRCIPTAWCCDRHADANCTVTYRPACCRPLPADARDEPEPFAPHDMTQPVRQNGGRYVFITLCVLATFFSALLLLLLLSKIFMLAKRARCREARAERLYLDECRDRAAAGCAHRARVACRLEAAGATDALLVLSDDIILRRGGAPRDERPPSYADVVSLEPPPPYTSQDCLNRN